MSDTTKLQKALEDHYEYHEGIKKVVRDNKFVMEVSTENYGSGNFTVQEHCYTNWIYKEDSEIIEWIELKGIKPRKMIRHILWLIIKIHLGVSKYSNREDLPTLYEKQARIQRIINQTIKQ